MVQAEPLSRLPPRRRGTKTWLIAAAEEVLLESAEAAQGFAERRQPCGRSLFRLRERTGERANKRHGNALRQTEPDEPRRAREAEDQSVHYHSGGGYGQPVGSAEFRTSTPAHTSSSTDGISGTCLNGDNEHCCKSSILRMV